MKRIVVILVTMFAFAAYSAAIKRGKEQLRELAVFPEVNTEFKISFRCDGTIEIKNGEEENLPEQIAALREELKQQPNDPQRQLQLGRLLSQNNETNAAQKCFEKVEQLCMKKTEAQPRDWLSWIALGDTRDELDKEEGAENAYRKALLVSSNEWQSWIALGSFLDGQSMSLLVPNNVRKRMFFSQATVSQEFLDYRPGPAAFRRSQELQLEASRCFDRAVSLAPNEPEVFLKRAGHRCQSNSIACLNRHFRNEERLSSDAFANSMCCSAAVPDLQRAAQLSTKDYRPIAAAVFFEWSTCLRPLMKENPDLKPSLDRFPERTQLSIRAGMQRLEGFGKDSDGKIRAAALETLALLELLQGNGSAARTHLNEAITFDPDRDSSRIMLFATAGASDPPEEKVKLRESLLKCKDTVRNHLILADSLADQKKWDQAIEQGEAALLHEPENVNAHLLLAALNIRKSEDPEALAAAVEHQKAAGTILNSNPPSSPNNMIREQAREMLLDAAILAGLLDDSNQAREILDRVSQYFPGDETAKEIRKALE